MVGSIFSACLLEQSPGVVFLNKLSRKRGRLIRIVEQEEVEKFLKRNFNGKLSPIRDGWVSRNFPRISCYLVY